MAFPASSASSDGQDVSSAFYVDWFAFARMHAEVLRNAKPLPVPPGPNVVDGTYAMPTNGSGNGYIFLFNPSTRGLPSPSIFLDASIDILCSGPAHGGLVVEEVWPVPDRTLTVLPCGQPFSIGVEARNALVLTVYPLSMELPGVQRGAPPLIVMGSASTAASSATLTTAVPATSSITISGEDAASPLMTLDVVGWADVEGGAVDGCAAPLYVLLPSSPATRRLLQRAPTLNSNDTSIDSTVRTTAAAAWGLVVTLNGVPVPGALIESKAALAATPPLDHEQTSRCASLLPGTMSAPAALPAGYIARVALFPAAAPSTTFLHGAPVAGMAYNASFAGGLLRGNVSLPAGVLAQLAARRAAYPVRWDANDSAIAWLDPARVLLYLDGGAALPQGLTVPASWDGAPILVQPVWSCRSLQKQQCFSGYFIEAPVAVADVVHVLTVTLPAMAVGAFGGVYYDNINTLRASSSV